MNPSAKHARSGGQGQPNLFLLAYPDDYGTAPTCHPLAFSTSPHVSPSFVISWFLKNKAAEPFVISRTLACSSFMVMASETLKHRPPPKDEPATAATTDAGSSTVPERTKDQKLALARRGLPSLAVAVAIPTVATATSISVAGTSVSAAWTPPVWAFHAGSLLMSGLLGLSSWLVWAKGGFHGRSEALPLYLVELVMELLWAPLLFGGGSSGLAMALCAAHVAVLFLLAQCFRHVNPVAADLIKPYLAWVSIVAVVKYLLL